MERSDCNTHEGPKSYVTNATDFVIDSLMSPSKASISSYHVPTINKFRVSFPLNHLQKVFQSDPKVQLKCHVQ